MWLTLDPIVSWLRCTFVRHDLIPEYRRRAIVWRCRRCGRVVNVSLFEYDQHIGGPSR